MATIALGAPARAVYYDSDNYDAYQFNPNWQLPNSPWTYLGSDLQ